MSNEQPPQGHRSELNGLILEKTEFKCFVFSSGIFCHSPQNLMRRKHDRYITISLVRYVLSYGTQSVVGRKIAIKTFKHLEVTP